MQNLLLGSPGAPGGATVFSSAGQPYSMTAHSFEIPMVISTSGTAGVPNQPTPADNAQQAMGNEMQQVHMVRIHPFEYYR